MVSKGKLWVGPSESTIESSVAAACNSKLNLRQKRLRKARPQARFRRLPNGECKTSCMLPLSSKNLSSTRLSCDGITPSTAFAPARYSTLCSAAEPEMPTSSVNQLTAELRSREWLRLE